MPPEATQGRSLPSAVPETPVYVVQGLDGRNAAHVSSGREVVVEPGSELAELVELGEGTAVPRSAFVSPQDVNTLSDSRAAAMAAMWNVRCLIQFPQDRFHQSYSALAVSAALQLPTRCVGLNSSCW
jgi:hypothetical protein